jgi:dGTPase
MLTGCQLSTAGLAPSEVIAKLRAASIRRLVKDAADAFISHETQLLRGTFNEEILNLTPASVDLEKALTLAMVKLYRSDDKTKLELAGERIIHGLLTDFMSAVSDLAKVEFDISRLGRRSGQIARVIGRPLQSVASTYEATLVVTDFISAMTDRFALQLYRSLNGIDI